MESKDNFQKSKVKWAVEGDENSKFFHGIINKRRAQLVIRGIFVDGFWETEPGMIKDAFFNHFASRFKEPANHRFKLNFEFNKKLHQNQMEDLERSVSRDEIRRAVWSCGDNKSPGPDGFTFEFFKKYWDCIGSDFCEAVEYFFVNSSFSKGCNSSFVALIPKVMNAKFVNDFRPISLIGSVYKVVTKVLANRLAPVIADLISDTQSIFVAGRQILDGPFILDEILHWCKRVKRRCSLQSICHKHTLGLLNLINGSPSKEYSCHRGLKQGDPLAPYLLYLIMESLHLSFNGCFFLASGLQINILKSQLLGVCVPHQVVEQAASLIGCSIMSNKFRYLGVMVGEYSSRIKAWDDVFLSLDLASLSGRCLEDVPLRVKFPRLFALDLNKEASVAVKLSAPIDISFRRNARGGIEEHLLADLTSLMDSVTLSNSGDRWVCDLVSDGNFRVKEIHCLPTRVNLIRRGITIESSLCPVCSVCEEDVCHIFFRCDLAQLVLRRICRWWGLDPHDWSSFQEWQSWILSIQFSSKFCKPEYLEQLCIEEWDCRHLTVPGNAATGNRVAICMKELLMDKVRCLLIQSGLPKTFWAEATCTAAYLINRSPSTAIEKKTPMEMWSGHPSDYGMLRIFGCVAYPHDKQGKLDPRAIKCVLLGYPEGVKGYRLYRLDGESPKIVTSRNVVFNESVMYKDTLKDSGAGDKSVEELQVEVELQRLNNHTPEEDQTDQEDGDDEDAGDQETDQPPDLTDYQLVRDREPRTRTKPLRFQDESNMAAYAFAAAEEEDTHEPLTYQEAVACEDSSK
ncbi:RNA-directed DNA polymerase, eukaryota [Tanacetum coccineum]|uniref:RNA-directed DNA polymerase, eukaryota n=1 Tax=Tanacetum coccineum TaxID=301880 RepID=A0ABQ5IYL8_9ASTR